MALVVTSRSPDLIQIEVAQRLATAPRGRQALPRLAVASVAASVVALVLEAFARALPSVAFIDVAQTTSGAVALALALVTCVSAWLLRRDDTGVLLGATLAVVLTLVRSLSTAVLVSVDLSTVADVSGAGLGLLVVGVQVWTLGALVGDVRARGSVDTAHAELFRRVAEVTAFVVFAVALSGATVRAVGAGWACAGGAFPDCSGLGVLPFGRDPLADVQLYHRLLSYMALGLVAWLAIEAFRTQRGLAGVPATASVLLGLIVVDAAVGVASVNTGVPPLLQLAHAAASLATWCAAVALVVRAHRPRAIAGAPPQIDPPGVKGGGAPFEIPRGTQAAHRPAGVPPSAATAAPWGLGGIPRGTEAAHRPAGVPPSVATAAPSGLGQIGPAVGAVAWPAGGSRRGAAAHADAGWTLRRVAAYVQLTKPRVMSLLLATTATAMVIAARGMPDLGTFLATLLGGALMSGGAGAINHYVDRDIDPLMGRTAWRPIPSGVIAPRAALRFGIALAFIASGVFVLFVNVLACFLAILGLLGYVFIYTLWLKRSTPSNIVIGGAAGAIPPLVGWAAVTNEIGSLTAWYLFAIIFFWTPPHFWALSLLIRQHYERAGVPMLPVVRGEDETRMQIVLYSVLLVVLTLVLWPFGMMGGIYFAAAIVLGALFILDAARLLREATRAAARRLYLYSILYLFVLFAAMAVDRVVF